ncbi:MAG: hypothetical protein Q8P67_07455 [archaeon]|nr:hypothetical protein [archaeon]
MTVEAAGVAVVAVGLATVEVVAAVDVAAEIAASSLLAVGREEVLPVVEPEEAGPAEPAEPRSSSRRTDTRVSSSRAARRTCW